MGRCQSAKSLRGLPGTESKQAQTLPADNLASPSAHRHKSIQNMAHSSRLHHRGVIGTCAFRRIFKGANLIHMCTMKLAILYPASPPLSCLLFLALPQVCNPTTDLAPYNLFLSSPTIKCHSVLLSESAQGFDHNILSSEGGQGCLILAGCTWQDFTHLSFFVVVFVDVSPRAAVICCDLCLSIQIWPKTNSICFSFAYT